MVLDIVVVRCPYFSVHLKILEAVLEADRLIRVYEVSKIFWSTATTTVVLSLSCKWVCVS